MFYGRPCPIRGKNADEDARRFIPGQRLSRGRSSADHIRPETDSHEQDNAVAALSEEDGHPEHGLASDSAKAGGGPGAGDDGRGRRARRDAGADAPPESCLDGTRSRR